MDQMLLTCPLCKRVNEPGVRFCRSCGRLLLEPDLEIAATEHAPLYEGHSTTPAQTGGLSNEDQTAQPGMKPDVKPDVKPDMKPDVTRARLLIRTLPGEDDGDDTPAPRVGEYALEGRTVLIGRTHGCNIIFDGDTQTSRRHAILRREDNQYTVADLGSSNGTFVNDLEIGAPTPLQHGDRILIGQHELLYLLDQPQVIAAQSSPSPHAADDEAVTPSAPAEQQGNGHQQALPTGAPMSVGASAPASVPAGATAKYASVARLSTELAASASRMVAPQQNDAELDAIRARLLEASEALTRQVGLQAALAERRRAALVETRERLADLIADLRGDDTVEGSPIHHNQQIGLQELVESVATDPNNLERVRALASRADELARALRAQGPSEGRWSYERALTLRSLEDMLFRLRELA